MYANIVVLSCGMLNGLKKMIKKRAATTFSMCYLKGKVVLPICAIASFTYISRAIDVVAEYEIKDGKEQAIP